MGKHELVITTPSVAPPSWAFTEALLGLRIPMNWLFFHSPGYGGTDAALDGAVMWMLKESDAKWLVVMASDAIVHPRGIARLLSWGEKCVAALAFIRYPPYLPVVYRHQNGRGLWKSDAEAVNAWMRKHPGLMDFEQPATLLDPAPIGALWPVGRFGTHVTLVHRDVLEAIGGPWFERQSQNGGGEDFAFVEKVEAAGFQPYVDMSQVAAHESNTAIGGLNAAVWGNSMNWETGEVIVQVDKSEAGS